MVRRNLKKTEHSVSLSKLVLQTQSGWCRAHAEKHQQTSKRERSEAFANWRYQRKVLELLFFL